MNKFIKHIITHWKTSLGAAIIGSGLIMFLLGKITATEFESLLGTVITVGLFAAKDWDKTENK
jgi:hypothetical protein